MNNSRRTKIIAQGIALYSALMDQTHAELSTPGNEIYAAWEAWTIRHPTFADFVRQEQFDFFDRVNAAF